jgi:hypothetical protein
MPRQNDDSGEGAFMRPGSSGSLTCQGWGASRGIKGGSAPLASSYRGPDNVAGPILGRLNPVLAVVSAVVGTPSSAMRGGRWRIGVWRVISFYIFQVSPLT